MAASSEVKIEREKLAAQGLKRCSACKEIKDKNLFSRRKSCWDGLEASCKDCYSKRLKERRLKNPDAFRKRENNWRKANPEKVKQHSRTWRQMNPEEAKEKDRNRKNKKCPVQTRRGYLLRTYQITLEQYNTMLDAQDHKCAVCEEPMKEEKNLHIDHDHSCCPGKGSCGKCIRGLLCSNCNSGIGMLQDSREILTKAVDYLDSHIKF